jgi:hypothetical protein
MFLLTFASLALLFLYLRYLLFRVKVPHLRRSHGGPGQAGSSSIDAPALAGWADVWRAGPPGLGSGWVLLLRFSHAGANQALALPAIGEAKQ